MFSADGFDKSPGYDDDAPNTEETPKSLIEDEEGVNLVGSIGLAVAKMNGGARAAGVVALVLWSSGSLTPDTEDIDRPHEVVTLFVFSV